MWAEDQCFDSQPFVQLGHALLQRIDLILEENVVGRFDIPEVPIVFGDNTDHLRRHPLRGEHVVAGEVLDVHEFILGSHIGDRHDRDSILLPIGDLDEHVLESADALGLAELLFDLLAGFAIGQRFRQIEDEPGMRAVEVIAPAEQRGVLIKQIGQQR